MLTKENKFKLFVGLGAGAAIVALAGILKLLFLGTISLIGIAVVGVGAFIMAPVFVHQLTVWKFRSLKAMVPRDPINHRIAVQSRRHKAIETARLELVKKKAAVLKFKRNCEEMIKKYPAKKEELDTRLRMHEQRFAIGITAYVAARENYEETKKAIEFMEAEWENACAEWELGKALGSLDNFMDDLIERTAIKAVEEKSDEAFAMMQMAMVDSHADGMIAKASVVHAVNYSSDGSNILLGNILDPIKVTK